MKITINEIVKGEIEKLEMAGYYDEEGFHHYPTDEYESYVNKAVLMDDNGNVDIIPSPYADTPNYKELHFIKTTDKDYYYNVYYFDGEQHNIFGVDSFDSLPIGDIQERLGAYIIEQQFPNGIKDLDEDDMEREMDILRDWLTEFYMDVYDLSKAPFTVQHCKLELKVEED